MPNDNQVDSVYVKLTDFGASLGRVQVREGIYSFDFRPGEVQQIERAFAWEKILKLKMQGGKALFEIVTEPAFPDTPACPICGGSGWKSMTNGKSTRVTRCECRKNALVERLLKAASIPRRYKHCTLADFSTSFPSAHPSLAKAWEVAREFIKEYPNEGKGLLLIGPPGVGKTHLAVAIIKELITTKNRPCIFCDYRELLKQIQNSYNPQVQTTELEVLRPIFEAEVLVLDELGAIRPSEWVWDTVSHILNYRYSEQKTTIITTNFSDRPSKEEEEIQALENPRPQKQPKAHLSKEEAEFIKKAEEDSKKKMRRDTLGDRITDSMRSRLHEMCQLIRVEGVDFRLRVKSANVNMY